MASLIVVSGIFLHNKIKERKEKRQEKKRQAYEKRYTELEADRRRDEQERLHKLKKRTSTIMSVNTAAASPTTSPVTGQSDDVFGRRGDSLDSAGSPSTLGDRSEHDGRVGHDGPAQWVDEARRYRSRDVVE